MVAAILREGFEVPGREGQFQNTGEQPILNFRIRPAPWRGMVECRRRQDGNLFGDEEVEMRTANLEARSEVTGDARQVLQ